MHCLIVHRIFKGFGGSFCLSRPFPYAAARGSGFGVCGRAPQFRAYVVHKNGSERTLCRERNSSSRLLSGRSLLSLAFSLLPSSLLHVDIKPLASKYAACRGSKGGKNGSTAPSGTIRGGASFVEVVKGIVPVFSLFVLREETEWKKEREKESQGPPRRHYCATLLVGTAGTTTVCYYVRVGICR